MGLSRKHLRILTGLLTGYAALTRHQIKKFQTDPRCPKCGEEKEAVYHFLGIECNATIMARYYTLGSHLMEINELMTSSTAYSPEVCQSHKEIYLCMSSLQDSTLFHNLVLAEVYALINN